MSELNSGWIGIGIPEWYRVDSTFEYMYPNDAQNMCSSTCFRTISSSMVGNTLMVEYDQMLTNCVKDTMITVSCTQFRNPISQKLWDGFTVTTFDQDKFTIDSSESVSLNAAGFDAAIIPASATTMQLSSYTVGEETSITLAWSDIPIPIE